MRAQLFMQQMTLLLLFLLLVHPFRYYLLLLPLVEL